MSNLKTTVLALVLVVLTAGALWYTSRAVKLGYTNVYCAPYGGCPQWQERGLPLFILAIFSGHLEKLPPFRRLDDLLATTDELGADRHGRTDRWHLSHHLADRTTARRDCLCNFVTQRISQKNLARVRFSTGTGNPA
jgi:hypothetical protein